MELPHVMERSKVSSACAKNIYTLKQKQKQKPTARFVKSDCTKNVLGDSDV